LRGSGEAQGFFVIGVLVCAGPPGGAVPGLTGAISAEFGFTLGALAAVGAGECAPEVSSGF